jgi:hypothetical protein
MLSPSVYGSRRSDTVKTRKLPVPFIHIKSVPHDKDVGNHESTIVGININHSPRRLVEERTEAAGAGALPAQVALEKSGGESRIDDIVDDEDISPQQGYFHVVDEAHFFRGNPFAVAGDPDKVYGYRRLKRSQQIGEEDERSLENTHDGKRIPVGIAIDSGGQAANGTLYRACSVEGNEFFSGHVILVLDRPEAVKDQAECPAERGSVMSAKRIRYMPFGMIVCLASVLLFSCGEGETGKKSDRSGEEVKREIGEAYEATKDYLQQKSTEMGNEFDRRLRELDDEIEVLREKAAATSESGREKAEEALDALSRKQEDVRKVLEEFLVAGEAVKEDAARRLERAMEELDEAYRKARERYGSSGD